MAILRVLCVCCARILRDEAAAWPGRATDIPPDARVRDRLVRRRGGPGAESLRWMASTGREESRGGARWGPPPLLRRRRGSCDSAPSHSGLSRSPPRIVAGGDRVCALRLDGDVVYRAIVTSDAARVAEVLATRGVVERGVAGQRRDGAPGSPRPRAPRARDGVGGRGGTSRRRRAAGLVGRPGGTGRRSVRRRAPDSSRFPNRARTAER